MTFLTERANKQPARAVARDAGLRAALVETDRRNSETAVAMGMAEALSTRWAEA